MPKKKSSDACVSLSEGKHGRFVVQDIKDNDQDEIEVRLMMKPENNKSSAGKDGLQVLDLFKIQSGKGKRKG